ncbi:substrate-binding domain-containing protein [Streptomyces sp. NPDC005329]|uniref:substrate-binding domain-containing protein n=1 Tax=Streptomyces sp. NPDC005329 TaxID=3157034 RepID=UPI0033A37CBE
MTYLLLGHRRRALGVPHALHEAGRSVPGEISVVGHDDIPEAARLLPALTTVRTDFAEIGTWSLQVLPSRIDDSAKPPRPESLVPVDLVIRPSSGAAPGR